MEKVATTKADFEARHVSPFFANVGHGCGKRQPKGSFSFPMEPEVHVKRGRDRLRAVDVAEQCAVPAIAGVEDQETAHSGKWRLFGQVDVGGEMAGADERVTAVSERLAGGISL